MKRINVFAFVVAVAVAASAAAELSKTYKDWPDGPAGFLMTKKERKEFKKLSTDAEAEAFIELFWAKRDPDLETAVNEFKVDFDLRVEAADKKYGYANAAGSMTDRGRALIVMGPPSRESFFPAGSLGDNTQNVGGAPSSGLGETGAGAYQDRGGTEVWEYLPPNLPEDVKANSVLLIFRESRVGYGDFNLDRGERRNAQALKTLGDAPERFLLHEDLTEVPRLGFLAGSQAAASADLAVFDGESRPWPEGAKVHIAEGVMSEALHPLWAWVQLPGNAPTATRAVGRVTAAGSGEVVGTFDVATAPTNAGDDRAYEFSFPVAAGEWKIDLALLAEGTAIAVRTIDAVCEGVSTEATYISPLYWGANALQQSQAKLGDPFNVGGWHVIPRVNQDYTTNESVSYFAYILRPTLDEQGQGKFELTLALYMGDRKLTETPPQPVQISQVRGNLWMFGHGLPLQNFRKGGDFKLVVTLNDTLSDASRSVGIPMTVTRVDAAGKPVEE